MQYQLFVQSHSEQKFIASVVGIPMVIIGEGVTENEAIAHAKASLKAQLSTGKFVNVELDSTSELNFGMEYAGIFADDPTFNDWMAKLESIRNEANMVVDN